MPEYVGPTYSLLPLRFLGLDEHRYVVTNIAGEFVVLEKSQLYDLAKHRLLPQTRLYDDLKAKHFLLDSDSAVAIDLVAAKYRTKQAFLGGFTSLFMIVTTLRCDHNCSYCQVTHRGNIDGGVDITPEVADEAVEFVFRSPSPHIKIEFQGGESMLNFPMVQRIVEKAVETNQEHGRMLEFVIATNLSPVTDGILQYCDKHGIYISTSLDGPRDLHNSNRPAAGRDSYEDAVRGIRMVREYLGAHRVSALMTTTRQSLSQPEAIVDEYINQGFLSIFLRSLNPYGHAANADALYSIDEWLAFYERALRYIIKLNREGLAFREEYAALLLKKMLTPYATGYVDLQSPAGIGISGVVVNYDGCVYASDESRMLGEMGDKKFLLGNVMKDSYESIMLSESLLGPLTQSMAECVPGCSDCGMQPFCGSDPVRHYRMQGDVVGFKPTSDFCRKHMGLVRLLVRLLTDEPNAADVLKSWIR